MFSPIPPYGSIHKPPPEWARLNKLYFFVTKPVHIFYLFSLGKNLGMTLDLSSQEIRGEYRSLLE
jgi:hypothetical protein